MANVMTTTLRVVLAVRAAWISSATAMKIAGQTCIGGKARHAHNAEATSTPALVRFFNVPVPGDAVDLLAGIVNDA